MIVEKPVLPVFKSLGPIFRDALRSMGSMPGLMLACFLAVCALQWLRLALGFAPSPAWRNVPIQEWFSYRAVIAAFNIAQSLFYIPALIVVHRWILLDETKTLPWHRHFNSRYLRYLFYFTIFQLISIAIGTLEYFGSWISFLSFLLFGVYSFIYLRGCLIYSVIAIDRPDTRFADMFERTKGYFWRIFWIMFWSTLFMAALFVLALLARKIDQPAAVIAEALLTGAAEFGGSILLASANSHIYQLVGGDDRVGKPAPPPEADTTEFAV